MKELFFLVTSALQALLESQMSMTRNYFEPVLCRWRPWQPSNDVKEAEDFMAHYWSQSDNNRQDGKPRKIRSIIFFDTIWWCQMLKGIPSAWITKQFFYISDVKNNARVTSTALLKQIPETKTSCTVVMVFPLNKKTVILTAKKLSNNPNKQTWYLLYCFSS